MYGAAVIGTGPTPAPMTATISKQGFTAEPRRETHCVCFLMTMVQVITAFPEASCFPAIER